MSIGGRFNDMGRSASLLGAWVTIASVGAIALNAGAALDGENYAVVRILIACVGLVAAATFWSGRTFGKDGLRLILIWSVLQIPVFAQVPDGNLTKQLIDFPLGAESSTTINGVITDYSQIGVNLIGIGLLVWARSCQDRLDLWRRRAEPSAAI